MESPSDVEKLRSYIDQIDELIARTRTGAVDPNRSARDIFRDRASQRPVLELATALATRALASFPRNSELLQRRGLALSAIVTEDGVFPHAHDAESDLRTILAFEPNNLAGALQLLDQLFTFGALDDSESAHIAARIAVHAESTLISARALQVRALIYADRVPEARALASELVARFPDAAELTSVMDEITGDEDDEVP